MKPTIEILENITQNSKKNNNEVFTRLYRYLMRKDIYYVAYKNLYANKGAATKGINNDTADGFGEDKINKIITLLADETYKPKPTRRIYIQKGNGKMRPLGIPTFTDKLIQEVLRMILEAIYEPIFKDTSHGFRPKRSCHTALTYIKRNFIGVRWFIEGDIKSCFDKIDHNKLVSFISGKIKDARLIKLVYKFLKAGYLENWKYYNTYSGTPQGGIISPILANIYLHELDKFVETFKNDFDKPPVQQLTTEYNKARGKVYSIRKKIKKADIYTKPLLIKELHKARASLLKIPAKSRTDKKLVYVRYCDDTLMGINGTKKECEEIKQKLKKYLKSVLNMELSDEKTHITHSSSIAKFLSYDIRIRRNNQPRPNGRGGTQRTLSGSVELNIPFTSKIEKFLFDIKAVKKENNFLMPVGRCALSRLPDIEIIDSYNSELRGICNYYSIASNFNRLTYFAYIMEYSCIKTFARKYRCTIAKIKKKFKDGKGKWCIPYKTKSGIKYRYFANWSNCKGKIDYSYDCKEKKYYNDSVSKIITYHLSCRSTFEERLNAKKCEICGSENSDNYDIHHINKIKNLKGKSHWEQIMIAKKRKTIVVCKKCHHEIHK